MERKQRGDCFCPIGVFSLEQMMKVSTLTHYVGSGAIIGVGIVFYGNPDPGQKDPPR